MTNKPPFDAAAEYWYDMGKRDALLEAADALDESEWYTVDQAVEFLRGYAGRVGE